MHTALIKPHIPHIFSFFLFTTIDSTIKKVNAARTEPSDWKWGDFLVLKALQTDRLTVNLIKGECLK